MNPAQFGYSSLPLHHAPYDAISPQALKGCNTGKVALVTGAGQGIGAAISESLAKSGANLALIDLTTDSLVQTQTTCLTHGVHVATFAADVTDATRIAQVLAQVESQLGAIDIVVNNAGILSQRPFLMAPFDAFWRHLEVNFKAPLQLLHELLPRIQARGSDCCIINIASRSGTVDVPMTLGYVTSKAALIRATHTLQLEMQLEGLDPAVHLYALHPGGVRTGIGGVGAEQDVKERYGDSTVEKYYEHLFKDGPSLCGQTCAWLASGRGKQLRGLFLDCRQDVGKLLEIGRDTLLKEHRNRLTVNFIDGYCNEP